MAIDNLPIPRFVADASQHGIPHGRFAERLRSAFRDAIGEIEDLPEGTALPEQITWFPERSWSGRVWIPASAEGEAVLAEGEEPEAIEFFGFVSFVQPEGDDPSDFRASADFTDVIAADNRDWSIDLSDEVIGPWQGENGRAADMTLVWGRSMVRDAYAATAEIAGITVDQDPLFSNRFTLIAPDALRNYGDEAYLEVHLWNSRGKNLGSESLYDIEVPESELEEQTDGVEKQ
ncbi:MAG: hypothetical protein KDB62_00715 [Solirubrobacterales bacterium]|nr:hypothetical protein [Solirubrobacterales bacterium]